MQASFYFEKRSSSWVRAIGWDPFWHYAKMYPKVFEAARHASSPRARQHLPPSFIATILRLQAIILTTAARYRSSASFAKIVSTTFLLRPLCFAATMSTSADLSTSLQVKKLSPSATIPTRGSPLSAGFDLSANEKKVCKTHA